MRGPWCTNLRVRPHETDKFLMRPEIHDGHDLLGVADELVVEPGTFRKGSQVVAINVHVQDLGLADLLELLHIERELFLLVVVFPVLVHGIPFLLVVLLVIVVIVVIIPSAAHSRSTLFLPSIPRGTFRFLACPRQPEIPEEILKILHRILDVNIRSPNDGLCAESLILVAHGVTPRR